MGVSCTCIKCAAIENFAVSVLTLSLSAHLLNEQGKTRTFSSHLLQGPCIAGKGAHTQRSSCSRRTRVTSSARGRSHSWLAWAWPTCERTLTPRSSGLFLSLIKLRCESPTVSLSTGLRGMCESIPDAYTDSIGECYVDDLDDISYLWIIQNPDKDGHTIASLGHH